MSLDKPGSTVYIIERQNVTESWKTVPNHTFLFHYIYYSNMNSTSKVSELTLLYSYMISRARPRPADPLLRLKIMSAYLKLEAIR